MKTNLLEEVIFIVLKWKIQSAIPTLTAAESSFWYSGCILTVSDFVIKYFDILEKHSTDFDNGTGSKDKDCDRAHYLSLMTEGF